MDPKKYFHKQNKRIVWFEKYFLFLILNVTFFIFKYLYRNNIFNHFHYSYITLL